MILDLPVHRSGVELAGPDQPPSTFQMDPKIASRAVRLHTSSKAPDTSTLILEAHLTSHLHLSL